MGGMTRLLHILLAWALLSTAVACKDEVKSVVKHPTDPEKVPTMLTRNVQTVISDSGHTRYRITTHGACMKRHGNRTGPFPRG